MGVAASIAIVGALAVCATAAGGQGSRDNVSPLVTTYCAGCHTGVTRSPSTRLLERFDPAAIADSPDSWAKVYRQLQAGTMPPAGARRPSREAVDAALLGIEQALNGPPARTPTSQEVAARLATLLWGDEPDAALRAEADRDGLLDAGVLEQQVRRMLADDRARAFVSNVFFPWLQLDTLEQEHPDPRHFPDYQPSLREAMAKETELFLLSQLREDRDPIDLWTAEYTFLNEPLASHYGVAGVRGSEFRRHAWATSERAGLLGHGSILMATSRHQGGVDAGYTSPAERSKWIRLHFLGAALPGGFPGAQPVRPELPITPQVRALPAQPCVNCHRNFFPMAYALENFDPIGRWRTSDQAGALDTSGTLTDGTAFTGVVELRRALLQRPDAFRTTITETLLIYADETWVSPTNGTPGSLARARRILREAAPRWSAIIAGVVRAVP
jgi:hypothetical protein